MRKTCTLFLSVIGLVPLLAAAKDGVSVPSLSNADLVFVENKGQVTDQHQQRRTDIQFQLIAPGLQVFIGNGQLHYQFSKILNPETTSAKEDKEQSQQLSTYRTDVTLVGANPHAQMVTEDQQSYFEQYYTASFGKKGATAYSFKKITYKEVYPHIDWLLYIKNNKMEYDFVVHPGGNVADIQIKYNGATALKLNKDGGLNTTTPLGTITEQAPYSYLADNGRKIKSSFKLKNNILSFNTAAHKGTLVIDPTLSWATYYGGPTGEHAVGVVHDNAGNVYMAGYSTSKINLATAGTYQDTLITTSGTGDAILVKFSGSGARLWATYFGGTAADQATGIACDPYGNIYINGYTSSVSAIATPGSYQTTLTGTQDAFLAKFTSSGRIVWSTYYGGSSGSYPDGVACDKWGNVYLAGYTTSTTGIATVGSYQATYGGGAYDAFLAKFDSIGHLRWATYYGGDGIDASLGTSTICSDTIGNIYMVGVTNSNGNSLSTPGAFQTSRSGPVLTATNQSSLAVCNGFLAKFDTAGARQWGTYFGGNAAIEQGYAVTCDLPGNVYMCGIIGGSDTGLATPNAWRIVPPYVVDPIFLAKFSASGQRKWCTYYSGEGGSVKTTTPNGLAADLFGNIWMTGGSRADSSQNIITADAYQNHLGGPSAQGNDIFLAKFDSTGSHLLYGTYYGGSGDDMGYGVTCTPGQLYFCGYASGSSASLATAGSFQPTIGGTPDAFLGNFADCAGLPPAVITYSGPGCPDSVMLKATATAPYLSYQWQMNGVSIANATSGAYKPQASGNYRLIMNMGTACADTSAVDTVVVYLVPGAATITAQSSLSFCQGDSVRLQSNTYPGVSYQWQRNDSAIAGAIDTTYTSHKAGTYRVVLFFNAGCPSKSARDTVVVYAIPGTATITAQGSLSFCQGDSVRLQSNTYPGVSYQWQRNDSAIVGAVDTTYAAYKAGAYKVVLFFNAGCPSKSVKDTVVVYPVPGAATVTAQGSLSFCQGDSVSLQSNTYSGVSYQWQRNDSAIAGAIDTTYTAHQAGNYRVVLFFNAGCPNKSTTDTVVVHPLPNPIVMTDGDTLSTGTYVTYQWYLNGQMISNATNRTYVAGTDGAYYVVVTDSNTCSKQSATDTLNNVGIFSINIAQDIIKIYPNPTIAIVHIDAPVIVNIAVHTMDGRMVLQQNNTKDIDMSSLPGGIYLMKVAGIDGTLLKVQKLIKMN